MLGVSSSYMVYYYGDVHSLYTHFVESFYNKWMLNFVKCFSTCIEMIICFLIFHFAKSVYCGNWFVDVEPSLLPWNKFHLTKMYANFFLGFLHLFSSGMLACKFPFFDVFWYQENAGIEFLWISLLKPLLLHPIEFGM